VYFYDDSYDNNRFDDSSDVFDDDINHEFNDASSVGVGSDYYDEYSTPKDDSDPSPSCPGSLRECLTACSPVIRISQVAYKLCVNECLDRCQ